MDCHCPLSVLRGRQQCCSCASREPRSLANAHAAVRIAVAPPPPPPPFSRTRSVFSHLQRRNVKPRVVLVLKTSELANRDITKRITSTQLIFKVKDSL
ncbi:hypothetical protein JTE90_010647 [Oedothorax gibbosus]|uniref:Uncharacterized protein n=1 Tax=Oedothorax gibbosus TaxID=931172 RepID=A0AAV6U9L2_9ARAC|nr:hypothetical protein JTE90_010647 [Oedothorax gibbosus]